MAPIALTPESSTGSPVSETTSFGQPLGSQLGPIPGGENSGPSGNSGESKLQDTLKTEPDGINYHGAQEPIAIIGMACRFPGNVSTPAEFWELLSRARTGYTSIPQRRFDPAAFYHPNPGKGGSFNAAGGSFLDVDLAAFDAPFFGLTEKEAISMDPQQRLLLECTFESLESAGIPKHSIVGKDVGVFVGGSFPEYESHLFRDSDTIPIHQATGMCLLLPTSGFAGLLDSNEHQAVRMPCNLIEFPTFST